jgi:glutamate dehydrogenase (NADP+)
MLSPASGDLKQWLQHHAAHQKEFHQAVFEVAESLEEPLQNHKTWQKARVLERLCIPDKIVTFRVVWLDDQGHIQINRGWRVQHSNATGPYKGGLRFHPDLSVSILKFLAFEQTFKNALTGLNLGGAKGGADFDPKQHSAAEIERFCQAFMEELYPYIGPSRDIPAGDINVGTKEIGWMFGAYKNITGRFEGTLTGKGLNFGGSPLRVEATGYGLIFFVQEMLRENNDSLKDKKVAISGAGNVALHAAAQAIKQDALVVTLSNSKGLLHCPDGLTQDALDWAQKDDHRLENWPDDLDGHFMKDKKPWNVECDIALPCATQNELTEEDAKALTKNGCHLVAEGSNMSSTSAAIAHFEETGCMFGPSKACNAGGVALSGLEMQQNAAFHQWSYETLCENLHAIMKHIHRQCLDHAPRSPHNTTVSYRHGANRAAFEKVAQAIVAQGAQ